MDGTWQALAPHLRPGETLLWAGRPDPAKHVGPIDAFLIPFSLLWGGFAIFWEVSVLREDAPLPFVLFGLAFVLIGLYFIAGRFVVKAIRKRHTTYGLTRDRALVVVGRTSVSDTPLAHTSIEQTWSRNRRHLTVTFGRPAGSRFPTPSYANTGMEFLARGAVPLGFHDVPDPTPLEQALRTLPR